MKTKFLPQTHSRFALLFVMSIGLLASGCQDSYSTESASNASPPPLPKMTFHKPKTFFAAVNRLDEIHNTLNGSDQVLAPRKFKILEVIHGTGASAHSHYYLHEEEMGDHDHDDHDHEDMESKELVHDVSIDIFTEFVDVANWLPEIAADGEMDKNDWEQTKQWSEELERKLRDVISSDQTDVQNRESFRNVAKETGDLIAKLKEISAANKEPEAASQNEGAG